MRSQPSHVGVDAVPAPRSEPSQLAAQAVMAVHADAAVEEVVRDGPQVAVVARAAEQREQLATVGQSGQLGVASMVGTRALVGGEWTWLDGKVEHEVPKTVFDRMLTPHLNPVAFMHSPEMSRSLNTAKNPVWLLFGWDHQRGWFNSCYKVDDFPDAGQQRHGIIINFNFTRRISRSGRRA